MIAATSPQRIAVIGAGAAGRAFAMRCVRARFAVSLEDVMPEKLRRAEDVYGQLDPQSGQGTLRVATEVEDAVHDADLAVDFVPDELESKLEIFSLLDRMAPPRTILLTPTEALSLDDLASCTYRPALCVGVRGSLADDSVLLVRGRLTSPESLAAAESVLARVGLLIHVVEDRADSSLTARRFTASLPNPAA